MLDIRRQCSGNQHSGVSQEEDEEMHEEELHETPITSSYEASNSMTHIQDNEALISDQIGNPQKKDQVL